MPLLAGGVIAIDLALAAKNIAAPVRYSRKAPVAQLDRASALRTDARSTWNDERWVVDRLIDAVETGDTDAKAALGQRLLDGIRQDGWTVRLIEDGMILALENLAPSRAGGGGPRATS